MGKKYKAYTIHMLKDGEALVSVGGEGLKEWVKSDGCEVVYNGSNCFIAQQFSYRGVSFNINGCMDGYHSPDIKFITFIIHD